jgi:hypothetical protein
MTTTPAHVADAVRAAIQAVLDGEGDGYHVAQFVVCMGIERVSAGGEIESAPWVWAPPSQPDWMTGGLLDSAKELHESLEDEDADDEF